jgi:putative DNA primase/helicase
MEMAQAPEWFYVPDCVAIPKPLKPLPTANGSGASGQQPDDTVYFYCRQALENARERLAETPEGARNTALNNEALGLGHLAHHGCFTQAEVRAEFLAACELNGLISADGINAFEATFLSGWRKGVSEPREVVGRHAEVRKARKTRDMAKPCSEVGGSVPEQPSPQLLLDPTDPLSIARLFLQLNYKQGETRTLHKHAEVFVAWNGACYRPVDMPTIRSEIYMFLEGALRQAGGQHEPFKPTMARVTNVIDALGAITNLPSSIRAPQWLEDENLDHRHPATEILSCANGLLHLPSRTLTPPTPTFYSLNSLDIAYLDIAYDPNAPKPSEWLKFLNSLWPDDNQAIETLQEWAGYCLTSDTEQQKSLLIMGPKRSGKGTIARVLTALLGQPNVCSPTLSGLGQNFGLAPLIGKQLAIIADARLSSRIDQHAIAERLLSISGEDGLTVDRKYLEPWTGQLTTRFMIMTNELPRVADASGALTSRFIVLTLQHSFYGVEDCGLTQRLISELPGILNWAIDGLHRLRERGYFVQPASSAEAIRELEDLGSPIGAFVRERCDIGNGREVECSRMFEQWKLWCQAQGRDHPGTVQSFGRDLRAFVPGLQTPQRRERGERVRYYSGVSLKDDYK